MNNSIFVIYRVSFATYIYWCAIPNLQLCKQFKSAYLQYIILSPLQKLTNCIKWNILVKIFGFQNSVTPEHQ